MEVVGRGIDKEKEDEKDTNSQLSWLSVSQGIRTSVSCKWKYGKMG